MFVREWRYLEGERREEFVAERRRYEERFRALFREGRELGELRTDLDDATAALLALSAANWAYTWLRPGADTDALADRFTALLLDGMRGYADSPVDRSTAMRIRSALLAGLWHSRWPRPRSPTQAPGPRAGALARDRPGAGLSGVAGVARRGTASSDALGITPAGSFRVDFGAGPGSKLVLVRRRAALPGAPVHVDALGRRAVLIAGVGVAGGAQVRFHALVVDGGKRDVFKLDWGRRASVGGPLSHGAIVIH